MKNWEKIKDNPQLWKERIRKANQIIKIIREFFDSRDYLEVYTPLVVAHPGMEPYLNPFKTKLETVLGESRDAYLITSPEYSMKKLLAGGLEKIYQIVPCFRNGEDFGGRHNPEFQMIEWYQSPGDYMDIMKEMGELLQKISLELFGNFEFEYQNNKINLNEIEYITVAEAMLKYAVLDLEQNWDLASIKKTVEEKGYDISTLKEWDDYFFIIFLNEVEPQLGQGKLTFLYDYPKSMAALAKNKDDKYAERFEAYVNGLELANGFSELLDGGEQLARLQEEQSLRAELGKDRIEIDNDFIKALNMEILPSGGVALGLSRLQMFFLDLSDLNDLLLFPARDLFV